MRELNHPNHEDLWFLIGNKHRQFSIGKFALMIGLRCVSDLKSRLKTGDDSFKEYYFKDLEKLRKGNLETVFLLSQFRSDEQAVNIVALYFINNFLILRTRGSW